MSKQRDIASYPKHLRAAEVQRRLRAKQGKDPVNRAIGTAAGKASKMTEARDVRVTSRDIGVGSKASFAAMRPKGNWEWSK